MLLHGNFKLLVTLGSMAVLVVAPGRLFGFAFAIGFVLLLLLHELGHVAQLRHEGIKRFGGADFREHGLNPELPNRRVCSTGRRGSVA